MPRELRPTPKNKPRWTAYHEAWHAVVGRVLTLVCEGASIKEDLFAGYSGIADPSECEDEWRKRGKRRHSLGNPVLHARIITFMAGAEAEVFLLGSTQGGDGNDRSQIKLMAEELSRDPLHWDKREARLRAMTRMLVRRHKDRIERVANALLTKETISAKQIDKLVGRSVDDVRANAPMAR
jgi:ATP-dependent Zn protease